MTGGDPISVWIKELRNGEELAAEKIWKHFSQRLTAAARKRLAPVNRRVYDEDDAAQSAFRSLWQGMAAGRFPDLKDRDSLWRLLLVITARKVSHRRRYDQQERRDVRRTETGSVFLEAPNSDRQNSGHLASREPSPEFVAEVADTCSQLFDALDDPELTKVALLKIDGHTGEEIAQQLDCSRRTVYRRIELIRRLWEETGVLEQSSEA